MLTHPSVVIIILTWNSSSDIVECLTSVLNIDYPSFKVIVVDNNSKDNTTNIVEDQFSQVELLKLPKNYYFTMGNNKGFQYALKKYNPHYLMILNPDTVVEKDLIKVLISKFKNNKNIVAVGPKLKFKGGKYNGKINSASLFYDGFRSAYDIGFGETDNGQYNHTKEVFGVTGACILFKSEIIKRTKGFWGILKMYIDEVELFIRIHKLNYKVIYTGQTTVWHKYMQSTKQDKTNNYDKLKMRNWLLIALRHYSLRDKLKMIRDYLQFIF